MFDDDLWYKDALRTLFREISKSDKKIVYGKIRWFFRDPVSDRQFCGALGDMQITPSDLLERNMVSNHAVMLKKEVIDRVGMYDPHILIRRLADWDLWRRVIRHFPMHRINHWIGEAWGPATSDSLGATVSSDWDTMLKYMTIQRDEVLKENVITDFVVNDISLLTSNFSDIELFMVNKVFEEYYAQVGHYHG
jgi:hypothetical protein